VNGRVSYNRTLSPTRLIERIRVGKGERPADLVLKRGKVVNVFSGEIGGADVAIHDGVFVGVGPQYQGRSEVDLAGRFVAPGLIDGHIHIESTMMTPPRLAEALVVHGTTTIVSDPHEIANVMGMEGIRYMLRESESIPLDVFFTAPSCVPSSHLETSGATLSAEDLRPLREHPRVLGLAEVMNFPGLLAGERGLIEKALLFRGGVIDGHCPGLRGAPLQAYVAAGIRSDHETIDPSEALEKLRAGMMVMIREGTSARNLSDLLPVVTKSNVAQFCFVSDDLHPEDILHRGHMNFVLRKAVLEGLDPVDAIRMVTINPARYFGLNDRGAVAPGLNADCVVFEDLEEFSVSAVYKNGRSVARDGRSVQFLQGRAVRRPYWTAQHCTSSPGALSNTCCRAPGKGHRPHAGPAHHKGGGGGGLGFRRPDRSGSPTGPSEIGSRGATSWVRAGGARPGEGIRPQTRGHCLVGGP
jgi:adenine deaminase